MNIQGYLFDARIVRMEANNSPKVIARVSIPLNNYEFISDSFTVKSLVSGAAVEVQKKAYESESNHQFTFDGKTLDVDSVVQLMYKFIKDIKEKTPKAIKASSYDTEKYQYITFQIEKVS